MSRTPKVIGRVVAFVGAPATASDPNGLTYHTPTKVTLHGLFIVDEFLPYEPAAYVHEAGYIVCNVERYISAPGEAGVSYFVTADEFDKQVYPKAYGRQLVQERELQMAADDGRF